jgi:hypothetical protein
MRFTALRLETRLHLADLANLAETPGDVAGADTADAIKRSPGHARRRASVCRRCARSDAWARRPPDVAAAEGDPFVVLDRFHLAILARHGRRQHRLLLALMIIRAEERRETVGAMRLLGISRRSLLVEVAIEGLLIAAAGALFGALLAFAAESLVNRIFQSRYDTTLVFLRVTRSIALRSFALAVPLGVAGRASPRRGRCCAATSCRWSVDDVGVAGLAHDAPLSGANGAGDDWRGHHRRAPLRHAAAVAWAGHLVRRSAEPQRLRRAASSIRRLLAVARADSARVDVDAAIARFAGGGLGRADSSGAGDGSTRRIRHQRRADRQHAQRHTSRVDAAQRRGLAG